MMNLNLTTVILYYNAYDPRFFQPFFTRSTFCSVVFFRLVKKVGEMRPVLQEAQRLNADGKTVLIDVHTSMESKQSWF